MKPWTTEEGKTLLDLRNNGLSWAEIGFQFPGRTPKSLQAKYHDILATDPNASNSRWTDPEISRLKRLVEIEQKSFTECDRLLNRKMGASYNKYRDLRRRKAAPPRTPAAPPVAKQPPWEETEMSRAAELWRQHITEVHGNHVVPRDVKQVAIEIIAAELGRTHVAVSRRVEIYGASFGLKHIQEARQTEATMIEAERRRRAADLRSFTAAFCGDPPPGYSALDLRRRIAPNTTPAGMEMATCGGSGPTLSTGMNTRSSEQRQ